MFSFFLWFVLFFFLLLMSVFCSYMSEYRRHFQKLHLLLLQALMRLQHFLHALACCSLLSWPSRVFSLLSVRLISIFFFCGKIHCRAADTKQRVYEWLFELIQVFCSVSSSAETWMLEPRLVFSDLHVRGLFSFLSGSALVIALTSLLLPASPPSERPVQHSGEHFHV